jgi:hypothetical protein
MGGPRLSGGPFLALFARGGCWPIIKLLTSSTAFRAPDRQSLFKFLDPIGDHPSPRIGNPAPIDELVALLQCTFGS